MWVKFLTINDTFWYLLTVMLLFNTFRLYTNQQGWFTQNRMLHATIDGCYRARTFIRLHHEESL